MFSTSYTWKTPYLVHIYYTCGHIHVSPGCYHVEDDTFVLRSVQLSIA